MNLKDDLYKKNTYLDTNIVSYFLDRDKSFSNTLSSKPLVPLVKVACDLLKKGELTVFTSWLVRSETLCCYIERKDKKTGEKIPEDTEGKKKAEQLLDSFESINTDIEGKLRISKGVIALVDKYNMSYKDSVHVMTAIEGKCQIFFTNDGGIKIPDETDMKLIYMGKYKRNKNDLDPESILTPSP